MTVGFHTVFLRDPQHYQLSMMLVGSVRAAMPHVPIVQLTDETSPHVLGVSSVKRKPRQGHLLEHRMQHYADVHGEWLLLDTDVIVQRDVRHVFDTEFDVALTDRHWPNVRDGSNHLPDMPFNTGVVFLRNPDFYQRVLDIWNGFQPKQRAKWMSEQYAVATAAREFTVRVLPGQVYNRPPGTADEDVSDAAIVHYKGPRKAWMRQRLGQVV